MQPEKNPEGRAIQLLLVLVWLAMAQNGVALPNSSPIQQQAAAAVVRDLHLDSSSGEVEQKLQVLAPFTALPAGATVHVVSARPGFAAATWLLRLDCDSRRECLPFHAVLRTAQFDQPLSRPYQPVFRRSDVTETRGLSRTMLVRSGNAVELVEQLPGVRLRVHVVCLQSGGLGDRIRVENRETHRVLSATVAGHDLVKVE